MRIIKTDAKLIDSVKGNLFIYKKRIPEHLHLYLMKNYRKESSCITGFENCVPREIHFAIQLVLKTR